MQVFPKASSWRRWPSKIHWGEWELRGVRRVPFDQICWSCFKSWSIGYTTLAFPFVAILRIRREWRHYIYIPSLSLTTNGVCVQKKKRRKSTHTLRSFLSQTIFNQFYLSKHLSCIVRGTTRDRSLYTHCPSLSPMIVTLTVSKGHETVGCTISVFSSISALPTTLLGNFSQITTSWPQAVSRGLTAWLATLFSPAFHRLLWMYAHYPCCCRRWSPKIVRDSALERRVREWQHVASRELALYVITSVKSSRQLHGAILC